MSASAASSAVMGILACIIFAFYFAFERGKPASWELVLVAQLSALCICARAVFSFVPYFNPVMALLMLSGVVLGAKKSFMTGSLTAFGSNFIFGQGPWTLYQMVSWGLAGVIFALLVKTNILKKNEWRFRDYVTACIASAFTVIFITGPLADLSGVFMFGVNDLKSLAALLAGGFILNLTLAASTVVTILLSARPLLFALSRAVSGNN